MLQTLELKQFAIAKKVQLRFEPGFTAITGATGSGKSLLVDALGVLLGQRAVPGLIAADEAQADIRAVFALTKDHPARNWLAEEKFPIADECELSRTLRRGKSSSATINGQSANAQQLRGLGSCLVDLHGQSAQLALLTRVEQTARLDAAADNEALLAELHQSHLQLTELSQQRAEAEQLHEQSAERRALLEYQMEELDQLEPDADDWTTLQTTHQRLHRRHEFAESAQDALTRLNDSEDGLNAQLQDCLRRLRPHTALDPALAEVTSLLDQAEIHLTEARLALEAYCADSQPDPEAIAQAEARFSAYHALSRKHRCEPEGLSELYGKLKTELATLDRLPKNIAQLKAAEETARNHFMTLAKKISARRSSTAKSLTKKINQLLPDLGMPQAIFSITLTPLAEDTLSRNGLETVEYYLVTNKGQPPQLLNRIASGGELSRLALALYVVLAASAPDKTLIFDEVDSGISGAAADLVGRQLASLGQRHQVLCLTHLVQVAARADAQWQVNKSEKAEVSVAPLKGEERVEALARLTSGKKLTEAALTHARQMLDGN